MSARGLVCLDYDGVLVDSAEHLLTLLARAYAGIASGRPCTREDLATVQTLTFFELARHCGVAEADAQAYGDAMFALQAADRHVPALFAGIDRMLARLAARHHVVVVTASVESNVRRVLAHHGVERHVTAVLDGTGHGDKARHIGDAAARFGVPVETAWMVGDAVSDIRAARRAGSRSIAVTWGYQPRERLAAEAPTHLADHALDVVALTG